MKVLLILTALVLSMCEYNPIYPRPFARMRCMKQRKTIPSPPKSKKIKYNDPPGITRDSSGFPVNSKGKTGVSFTRNRKTTYIF